MNSSNLSSIMLVADLCSVHTADNLLYTTNVHCRAFSRHLQKLQACSPTPFGHHLKNMHASMHINDACEGLRRADTASCSLMLATPCNATSMT
jgi:hypothetical protein